MAGNKKGEEKVSGKKAKSRVRAAIDAVGLSAVCFYLVVWLSLFLFNAVCLCVLWLLVPCLWGGSRAGGACVLLPAWSPEAGGFAATVLPHPI